MKTIYITSIIAMVAVGFTSCKKDKEDPVITVNTPANHSHFSWGETINATATFSDDRELANYHIHIADADGNHVSIWDYEDEADISGKTYEWSGSTTVPDSVPDMLYLDFMVTDAESKVTESSIMLHFEP